MSQPAAPPGEQALRRRRLRQEALGAAAIRALTGDASLHFRGGSLHRGEARLPGFGPHLHPGDGDDAASFRGAADGLALRLLLSDEQVHRELRPDGALERWVFEVLEQLRVESLVPAHLPGVVANLQHRFERWSEDFRASGLCETQTGTLLFTLVQMCRTRLSGVPPAAAHEEIVERAMGKIASALGTSLAGLRRHRAAQMHFAVHARVAAAAMARLLGDAQVAAQWLASQRSDAQPDATPARFSLWIELDPGGDSAAQPAAGDGAAGAASVLPVAEGYRVFTRAYDRELPVARLVRVQRLQEHRARLDRLLAGSGLNPARVARLLAAALLRATALGPEDGREEGLVDGRRIAALLSSPTERRLFRWHRPAPQADCVVSILVDCSGSMKPHREAIACLADLLLRALDAIDVGTELLGFTTGAWNGGRALRDWRRAGSPPAPGRLAEREHLVFKAASQPWRRARSQVAALLEPVLYREGVDGEALEWACARLSACEACRRVLLVISDGCPMESASAAANPPGMLQAHLREVVAAQRRRGEIEIVGVGVGLDLSPWYERSLLLDPATQLAMADLTGLARLLAN